MHSLKRAISRYRKPTTPCIVRKQNWNTKDKGKPMMRVLHILQLAKSHVSDVAMLNREKNQAHDLIHC